MKRKHRSEKRPSKRINEYENLTKEEMERKANELGITGHANMDKQSLAKALREGRKD